MNITAINGSPKRGESNSAEVISIIRSMIGSGHEWNVITPGELLRKGAAIPVESLTDADILLFVFPLYVDGIPSTLLRCTEAWAGALAKTPKGSKRIFAVVNCGFIEGVQNHVALDMMSHFSRAAGQIWCGGAGIGSGEMIAALRNVPQKAGIRKPVIAALQRVADAIRNPDGKVVPVVFTQHAIPWFLYRIMGHFGWRKMARKNGLKRRDLDARPLMQPIPRQDGNMVGQCTVQPS